MDGCYQLLKDSLPDRRPSCVVIFRRHIDALKVDVAALGHAQKLVVLIDSVLEVGEHFHFNGL